MGLVFVGLKKGMKLKKRPYLSPFYINFKLLFITVINNLEF